MNCVDRIGCSYIVFQHQPFREPMEKLREEVFLEAEGHKS